MYQPVKLTTKKSLLLLSCLLGLVGLQGCSSSSSTPAITTDQNASGLFTGGITLNSGTQRTDLRAFVHEGRFIIFSVDGIFFT